MVSKDAYRSRRNPWSLKNRLAETPLSSRPEAARKRGYCFGMRIVELSSTGADAEIRPEIFIFLPSVPRDTPVFSFEPYALLVSGVARAKEKHYFV
jgi:hypothetical protein